jgi:hypothetical protein
MVVVMGVIGEGEGEFLFLFLFLGFVGGGLLAGGIMSGIGVLDWLLGCG